MMKIRLALARRCNSHRLMAAAGLFISACVPVTAFAQPKNQPRNPVIWRSTATNRVTFVTGANGVRPFRLANGPISRTPDEFLNLHGRLFGITNPGTQLVKMKAERDHLNHMHTTFQQVHQGVPVFSGVLKIHQNAAGQVFAANGDFYEISPKLNVVPTIPADEAIRVVRANTPAANPNIQTAQLVIVDPGWYGDQPAGARLAHYIIVEELAFAVREAFFIDAHNGEVLDQWSLIHTARDRQIHDAMGTNTQGPLVRGEGDPPTGDFETDAAYDYVGDTYDYYFRAFGRDSLDDNGMPLIATVHFFSKICPNAFWNGQQIVFCDGLVTDDVVAHELTHGVTQFTASLIYQNQSGQLNESFSDVFGELVDLFNGDAAFPGPPGGVPWPPHLTGPGTDTPNDLRTGCGDGSVRWLLAEDSSLGTIRDMWDPPCEGDPDRANSSLQICNPGDNGGVHSGSGIPNHAFAITTDGKTFNGFTVTGIGPIKAGAVWYRTLSLYLTPASDFEDAYVAFNQAATDLIGTSPNDPRTGLPSADMFTAFDAEQVDLALQAVEMNTPGRCGQAETVLLAAAPFDCPNREVIFSDDFESRLNGWTVSNSGPSGPPTPYDWVQASGSLPFGQPGTVWFCEDRSVGNCGTQDESATHSLFSPVINIPANTDFPLLQFTHFLETEAGYDGGNLKVSVNAGPWQLVPRTTFTFNPYNARLNTSAQTSTNPLEGEDGWTGFGESGWAVSIVDLSGLVIGGDSLEVRFDFGKDGCAGITGWYIDDFSVYNCPDCDNNGRSDHQDFVYSSSSPVLGNIGTGLPQSHTLLTPPSAESDVELFFVASADLSSTGGQIEELDVDINGTFVGTVFDLDAADCPALNGRTPDSESLIVPASTFNTAVAGGNAVINMIATGDVNPNVCDGTFVAVFVRYDTNLAIDCNDNNVADSCDITDGTSPDCNVNTIPDECDIASGLSCDRNENGIPDECESYCLADINCDGVVNVTDLLLVIAEWGNPGGPADINGDNSVNVTDLLAVIGAWGPCP